MKRMRLLCVAAAVFFACRSYAQVDEWTFQGRPVVTAPSDQTNIAISSCASGRVITAWQDMRTGTPKVFYTFLDTNYNPIAGIVAVYPTGTGNEMNPSVAGEPSAQMGGGGVVVWQDNTAGSWDIYAQRYTSTGQNLWGGSPTTVCSATGDQTHPKVCRSTGMNGGWFVVWQDSGRTSAPATDSNDIYIQYLDQLGTPRWGANGLLVCGGISGQDSLVSVVPDGAGGAFVVWLDNRSGGASQPSVYVRWLDANGISPQWPAKGKPVAFQMPEQNVNYPVSVSDGNAGVIVAWQSSRPPAYGDVNIYAQRIDTTGALLWGANSEGATVCDQITPQLYPAICSDGNGGAIIAWQDHRNPGFDIYAQRMNPNGNALWQPNGVPVCTAQGDQTNVQLSSDGHGGAIAAWNDKRTAGLTGIEVYANRIDASGALHWGNNGVWAAIVNGTAEQNPVVATVGYVTQSDTITDACILWEDLRSPGNGIDIYGQRIGYSPQIFAAPNSHSFPAQRVGTTAHDTLYAVNIGDDTLTLTGFSYAIQAKTDTMPFHATGVQFPVHIPPGDSVAIAVDFTPKSNTLVHDTLIVANNSFGADSAYRMPLSGSGKYPHGVLTPDTLNFGNLRVGLSLTKTVSLKNTGTDTLHFSGTTTTGATGDYNDDGTTYHALAPDSSLAIQLTFSPNATGTLTAQYIISSDDSATPHIVTLRGTGIYPYVKLTEKAASFGKVQIMTSAQQTLGIINVGSDTLHLSNAQLSGKDSASFTASSAPFPAVVPMGDTLWITLTFSPQASRQYFALYSFTADDATGYYAINLNGIGSNSSLIYAPQFINYGAVQVGSSADSSITVQYSGAGSADTAYVLSAAISGDDSDFAVVNASFPLPVWRNGKKSITVQYKPLDTLMDTAYVTVIAQYGGTLFDTTIITLVGEGSPNTGVHDGGAIAQGVALWQNYPNPAGADGANSTTIAFATSRFLPYAELNVYNILGAKIATLYRGALSAGLHSVELDVSRLHGGIYFYRLEYSSGSAARLMNVAR